MEDIEKIRALVKTGVVENVLLAFELITSQNMDPDEIFKDYKELLFWYFKNSNDFDHGFSCHKSMTIKDIVMMVSTEITYLMIRGKGVKKVPDSISLFSCVGTIDFSENNISTLPESIKEMKTLKSIVLNDNKFSEFPKQLYYLRWINLINLDCNYIKEISDEIDGLLKLSYLYIAGNKLVSIPKMPNLKMLLTLDITGNRVPQMYIDNFIIDKPFVYVYYDTTVPNNE